MAGRARGRRGLRRVVGGGGRGAWRSPAEVAERARRWHTHPHEDEAHSYEFHRSALFAAGFVEVGTLWQHLANRVLVAIR